MTMNQLNCAACGAPINIPENREFINCPYCAAILAIIRGEGYTAFREVQSITKTLPTLDELTRKTGQLRQVSEPQPEPEPVDDASQISEQIQLAEMQMANLEAEIESFERALGSAPLSKQLRRLYVQKFQVLENLRMLNQSLVALGPQDCDSRIAAQESEVRLINAQIQALEAASDGESPEASSVWETTIDRMREYRRKLQIKVSDLHIQKIKEELASFQVKEVKLHDHAAIEAVLAIIRADQDRVARMSQTLEVSIVKDELTARYQALLKAQANLKKTASEPQIQPLMIPVSSADGVAESKPGRAGLLGLFKKKK